MTSLLIGFWSVLLWLFGTLDRLVVRAWLLCWKQRERWVCDVPFDYGDMLQ